MSDAMTELICDCCGEGFPYGEGHRSQRKGDMDLCHECCHEYGTRPDDPEECWAIGCDRSPAGNIEDCVDFD